MEVADKDETLQLAHNGCPSKGSMDIFVEPVKATARIAGLRIGAGGICLITDRSVIWF
jgi:hypothetical protein